MTQIQYGTDETTRIIDESGSTETVVENYVDWEIKKPSRHVFEFRKKVTNQEQEMQEYYKFSEEVNRDPKKLEPAFKIERSALGVKNGYYYVVCRYMVMEY